VSPRARWVLAAAVVALLGLAEVSYRTGDVSVVIAASDDNTAIAARHATDC
jgi:hypothetical protein